MPKKNSLKETREEKKMTQVEFAKKMKVSQAAVSDWENGRRTPSRNNVLNMSKVLGLSVTEAIRLIPSFFK